MTTEAEMVALLKKRYSGASSAGLPRYITAPQVPIFTDGAHRRIDFIAVDSTTEEVMLPADTAYTRLPPPVHGFEVKVSRADWLTEHRTGGKKSEPWRGHCHYWWLVVPNQKVIKPGELPAGWGLLVGENQLRAVVKPVRSLNTQPLDMELMRTIARHSQRKTNDHRISNKHTH